MTDSRGVASRGEQAFLKPFRLPFLIQETANRNAAMTADAFEQAAAVSALVKYGSDLAFWAELPDPHGQPDQWAGAYRENLEGLLRVALGRLQGEREQQQLRDFGEACRRLISLLDCKGQSWAVMDSSRAVSAGVQSLHDLRSQLDMVAAGVAVKTAAAAPAAAEPVAAAALSGGEPEPAAPGAVGIVDSDYSEARAKSEWAAMLGLDKDKGLRRKIKKGTYRVKPDTSKYAQNIRLHIDDLPQDLKNRHQRNQRAADVKRTTDGR